MRTIGTSRLAQATAGEIINANFAELAAAGGGGAVDADNLIVAAGTDGLDAGPLQDVIQALASRIAALEAAI